jgi:hypothetical protein
MIKRAGVVGILLALLALPIFSVSAFSPAPFAIRRIERLQASSICVDRQQRQHRLSASNDDESKNDNSYPGMSEEEITKWMADIPVYAITSKLQLGGIVLLKDPDDTAAAYYFLAKGGAQSMLKQMQISNAGKNDDWEVTPFSLGMIWFEILNKNDDDAGASEEKIDHRLVADSRDLGAAREHVKQVTASESSFPKFQNDGFNEIPIFMDLQMRTVNEFGEERFPMYVCVRDMVETCKQFMESNKGYEAAVNVADLRMLVEQMKAESPVNFRETLLVAPTPPSVEEAYTPSMDTEW